MVDNNVKEELRAVNPAEMGEEVEEWLEEEWPEVDHERLAALKGHIQCHNCKGWGHFANECPTKGKGKAKGTKADPKGKGKGAGKANGGAKATKAPAKAGGKGKGGKGKGPQGGCFLCGGPHYQNDCPQYNKVYQFTEAESTDASPIKALNLLQTKDPGDAQLPAMCGGASPSRSAAQGASKKASKEQEQACAACWTRSPPRRSTCR